MVTKLFTITFTDNSQLWATLQNNEVCFGTLGAGFSVMVRPTFEQCNVYNICYFAQSYADNSNIVLSFTDHAEEKSQQIKSKLITN